MLIGLGAALAAAVLFGAAAVVQAVVARHHGLVSWQMSGVGLLYLVGWGLHLVAIARLPLYVAQVGVAASLVVTALVAAVVVGEPLAPRHWVAIGAMTVGLALVVLASGSVGHHDFDAARTLGLYLGFVVTLVLGMAAMRVEGARGGVLLGVLGGVAYAGSPVATRALVEPRLDAETLLPATTILLYGLLGFWLYSVGMRRASVTAVTAPLVLLETVLPAVIGLTLFGDQVRPGWWPVALFGFVLSTLSAVVLCGAGTTLELLERPRSEPESAHQPL